MSHIPYLTISYTRKSKRSPFAKRSPLGNALLAYYEQNCLDRCPLDHAPLHYQRHVNEIFTVQVMKLLKATSSYLNSCHLKMSFTIDPQTEQQNINK